MSRLLKWLLLAVAGLVTVVIVAAVAFVLLFDPNDFRDRISAAVKNATGRELSIEGDLSVSLFPWLAVEMGSARLGNAPGFGDTPFLSFDAARLSVRLLPLILRREVAIGTAELDGLRLALAVNARGQNNWDDLAGADDAEATATGDDGGPSDLDISGIAIRNAFVQYSDAQAQSDYVLQNLDLTTGSIALGEAFDFSGSADFASKADALDGRVEIGGGVRIADDFSTWTFDDLRLAGVANGIASRPAEFAITADRLVANVDDSTLQPAQVEVRILGVDADLDIRSASWATDVVGEAGLTVGRFSPRDMAPLFDIELPETADPAALTRAELTAQAALDANALSLKNLALKIDDTSLAGEIVLPFGDTAPIRFELTGDSMNLDRYMAPATDAAAGGAGAAEEDFEIPVEMIRNTRARGTLTLEKATFAGMTFTNIRLGLTSGAGKLRLNPLSAALFEGNYTGDVQIDASGAVPTLAMNEKVADVRLGPLGKAMFKRDNLSGTINGSFVLNSRGPTLSTMRRNLNGNMTFELADGAWEGVDLWYQLRAARALYRREPPPEKRIPVRTEFSSVLAAGPVRDGVFNNTQLQAAMPYLQLTGTGTVDFVTAEMDYSLRARVLERPEFLNNATEAELAEFTEALIPVRVRGPVSDPSIRPDIEAMFRDQVDEKIKEKGDELKKKLLDRLLPGAPAQQAPAEGAAGEGAAAAEENAEAPEEKSTEEQLKERLLKKLFD